MAAKTRAALGNESENAAWQRSGGGWRRSGVNGVAKHGALKGGGAISGGGEIWRISVAKMKRRENGGRRRHLISVYQLMAAAYESVMKQRNGGINVAWQHQRHRRNDIGNEIMKIGGGSVAASSGKNNGAGGGIISEMKA
jgi:hypothetical protein